MMLIFDIETDGLLEEATQIHSLVIQDYETSKVYSCTNHSTYYWPIKEGLQLLSEADVIVGHNIMTFDLPVIKKLYPSFQIKGKVRDTLILSRLVYPDMYERDCERSRHNTPFYLPKSMWGRHSLEAWGYRLSERKDEFGHTADWSAWSEDMQAYCEQDVKVTACLWERFQQMDLSAQSVELEHQFQEIIFQQEQNGIPFALTKAVKLYSDLCAEREQLKQQLRKLWPPVDKGCWFTPRVNNKTRGYVKGVPIWKPHIVEFNPASREDIAERLISTYGWKPTEFSNTGKVKIDDEVLQSLPYPEAKALAKFFVLQKRIGQIGEGKQSWLKTAVKDGDIYRIHGHVTTNGAVTGRCTHQYPNLAQVPAVTAPWGYECRSLFYAPEGYSMMGCDASGLELRCLAHYMAKYDGGAYAQIILHGDIHWANAQALGLVPKDMERDKNNEQTEYYRNKIAKRFIYAFLYGAGAYKIGTVCGLADGELERYKQDKRYNSTKHNLAERGLNYDAESIAYTLKGTDLKKKFLSTLPALDNLIHDVQDNVKRRGYLIAIDKRILRVRSQHSALNTLLQSAGAIAVKKATCLFWDKLHDAGIDDRVQQVAHVHDEFQCLVRNGYEEQVGELAVQAFQDAGVYFKLRCPLDGEYKIGGNWSETH